MRILVTGGAGFIGSAFIRRALSDASISILNYDALTYAANPDALKAVDHSRYEFVQGNVCDGALLAETINRFAPDAIVHFAAESHVDRSIASGHIFIETNINGTHTLLEAAKAFWQASSNPNFKFIQISTDEVYGDIPHDAAPVDETAPFIPSSPYAASKAAADHLVMAWHRTYGFPSIITHCCNNFGPWQYREKLIPRMIYCALKGEPLPVYGNGLQAREWLHVDDHADAIMAVIKNGKVGERYNIGSDFRISNIELVKQLCALLDVSVPKQASYADQISYIDDRLGHDTRYAINSEKIKNQLRWQPQKNLPDTLFEVLAWYLVHFKQQDLAS